jgi:sec-independent protein translocase protein TatB
MFDIGFSELMVIAVVALIVIGPERLPKVARTLGHLFGRMQRYVNDVKADITREMQLDELKKLQANIEEAARSMEASVSKQVRAAETELQKLSQEASLHETGTAAGSALTGPGAASTPGDPLSVPTSPDVASAHPVAEELSAQDDTQLQLDLSAPPHSDRKSA